MSLCHQLIPGVLSDSRDPQGPLLLLRIQQSIRHLSYPLKQKALSGVSLFYMHVSVGIFVCLFMHKCARYGVNLIVPF